MATTTHFNKLTTGKICLLCQLSYKVTVTSCSFYITCSMFLLIAAGRRTLKMCCYRSRLVFSSCFSDTDISQGSVATHLRCGGIFSDTRRTNFLLILTVKKFEFFPIFDEVIIKGV